MTANQSLEAARKEMQSHRQGLSHIDDADYLLLLERKAQAGDIEAQITLGVSLMEGYAGREDQVMGLYWLKHAAEDERGKGFYDAYMSDSAEGYVC